MKLVTCESSPAGQADKIADQIADQIVDQMLLQDPHGRCGVEVLINSSLAVVSGEFKTHATFNIPDIVFDTLKTLGYTDETAGFKVNNLSVITAIRQQSAEISSIMDSKKKKKGATDQGIVFGYATDETPECMPLPFVYATKLVKKMDELRLNGELPYLRPDGKSQVTVEYDGDHPVRVDTVVIAAQHHPDISLDELREDILNKVIYQVVPSNWIDEKTRIIINQYGSFTMGGLLIDTGVTGRKLVSDTYGGVGNFGGGSFSGKDPSKLDRSGAYYGRYIAKNIVAAGLAKRCQLQIAYAFGEPNPVATQIQTFGTSRYSEEQLLEMIVNVFPFSTYDMIDLLELRRPIYRKTSVYGHFGQEEFPWEDITPAEQLRRLAD